MTATATRTAEKAFGDIQAQAEKIKSNAPHRIETMSEGDSFRQGDLYITFIGAVPRGAVRMKEVRLQLAPGETQGSRHVLDSAAGVQMFEPVGAEGGRATVLDGPVFLLTQRRTVTHPEHGHVSLPEGCYRVDFQRAFADELRAQRD